MRGWDLCIRRSELAGDRYRKRHFIRYSEQWQPGQMRFWVHIETDGQPWYQASPFEPLLPDVEPGQGFRRYYVEVDGFTFEFASLVVGVAITL